MKTNIFPRVAMAALAAVSFAACQPSFLNEGQSPNPNKSARESADWLSDSRVAYGSSMDVETYTYRIVEDYGNAPTKEMTQVNAAPRLHRGKN